MAKASAKTAVNIDDLIQKALLTIARSESPLRLTGKGPEFVLTSASGPNKEVLARLRDEARPLISESGSGKAATVALTRVGFERVLASLEADELARIARKMLDSVPAAEHVAFLNDTARMVPAAMPGLLPLLEAAMQAEKEAAESRAREAEKNRAAEAATLAALEHWKKLVHERKAQRVEALKRELAAEGAQVDELIPAPNRTADVDTQKKLPVPIPEGEDENDFRRNVARRLVSAWIEAWDAQKPDAREFLESAIWNIEGFRPIGEPNQRVDFDGRYHEGGSGLFTNDAARIVRPGWLLEEGDEREYIVLKAQVAKA
jgi:hypothetical protein